ncbi:MAG: GNAT family N-acetyltransferase [Phycisphaerales bacterium]
MLCKTRPATEHDCRLLWRWVNNPDVRRWSFSSDSIEWDAHVAWFRTKLADPNSRMYIVMDAADDPIGLVRLDVGEDDSGTVSVSIAPELRGRGYGTAALRLASGRFFADTDARRIVAHIKTDNVPSIRAFESAGFTHRGTTKVNGQDALCMILSRPADLV